MDQLCYASANGGELPADRCPVGSHATEIKFSPGGDKIFLRYDREPDLALVSKQMLGVNGVEMRKAAQNPQIVSARDHKVEIQLKSKGDVLMDGLTKVLGVDKVPDAPLRVEWVGPKAGKLLRDAAFKSVAIAIVFIMAYIAFRFDMRFAPGAVISMVHDVFVVMCIFILSRKEFTLSTVAAVLTIVGYSVNDTVIIYDRIRENLSKHRGMTFPDIINLSVSETLSRTLLTSFATLVSLAAFLFFGTGTIKDFAFALFFGFITGTYSSIFIASPITEYIDRRFFANQKKAPKAGAFKARQPVV
jgi:preprotein translocase subunit SecF